MAISAQVANILVNILEDKCLVSDQLYLTQFFQNK